MEFDPPVKLFRHSPEGRQLHYYRNEWDNNRQLVTNKFIRGANKMVESKYEKYVIRKPAVIERVGDEYIDKIPETDVIPVWSDVDTGPRVIFSNDFIKGATTKVEYGFLTGDKIVGNGEDFNPHKHDYEEIFLFLGTDPDDTGKLGAEIEFWLGEGDDLEKVVITTSSAVYVPAGLAHFPQVWKNVQRPVMTMVIMPTTGERNLQMIPMEERLKKTLSGS
jgi:hypothetical protein